MKTPRFCLGLIFFSSACVLAPQLSAEALTFEIEPSSEGLYNVGVFYDTVNQITLNFGIDTSTLVILIFELNAARSKLFKSFDGFGKTKTISN